MNPMRHYAAILKNLLGFSVLMAFALVTFTLTGPFGHPRYAHAMEALRGEVVSISRQDRQMVVAVAPANRSKTGSPVERQRVRVSYEQKLPGFVRTGSMVRLWGAYFTDDRKLFKMEAIRGGVCMRGQDATGVRSRLRHGCGRQGRHGMGKNRGEGCP